MLGILCARSLHFQFFTWYFNTLPLLLRFTRWPWIAHIAYVVALEVAWSHHPPAVWSSALVTALHAALAAALWYAGGRAAEADEADTASGARLLRAVRLMLQQQWNFNGTGSRSSSSSEKATATGSAGAAGKEVQQQLKVALPAAALAAAAAPGAEAPQRQRLHISLVSSSSKPLQQLAELILSPSPRPQSAAVPAATYSAAALAHRQRDL